MIIKITTYLHFRKIIQHIKDAQDVLETRKRNGTLDPDEPNLLLSLLSDSSIDFMDIVEIIDSLYIAGTDSVMYFNTFLLI